MTRRIARIAATLLLLAATTATAPPGASPKRELRCGWIYNPTPANWWLVDRDGQWVLGSQGGEQVPGLDTIPDLTTRDWVVTNGTSYGYGCGCLTADVDRKAKRITRIHAFKQKPLAACRNDRALARPEA